jgi:hypothetical protein
VFTKGTSGNPNGRPKGALNKSTRQISEIIHDNVDFDVLIRRLNERANEGSDTACRLILEYGHGKPTENMNVSINASELAKQIKSVVSATGTSISPQEDSGIPKGQA